MKKTFLFLLFAFVAAEISVAQKTNAVQPNDRKLWLNTLDKIARPVLSNLAQDKLKAVMPVELSKRTDNAIARTKAAYLEAFSRTLCGIAPWLNSEEGSAEEKALRNQYRQWVIKGMANAVNPSAKDYMDFTGGQSLVDAAFLANAFLRCPWLWNNIDTVTKQNVVDAFRMSRKIKPSYSNWILFSGMIEAFFCKYNYDWDIVRVEFCLRQFEQWYVGDGVYSDGTAYHWDYYNSYVIHPFLNCIYDAVKEKNNSFNWFQPKQKERSERYAIIQERLINADGSFPATGRSIVYRGAAFQHLADVAWQKKLPAELHPAQVRCALTAVLKKTMESPTTFNKEGWLTIGLYGSQPDIADVYNNTGSLYLCTTILLPLGLPETDPFWNDAAEEFSSQKIWSGKDVRGDHAHD